MTGWKGEQSGLWSVIFAKDGEEAGEVDFAWVVGCFVAEHSDFDFLGLGGRMHRHRPCVFGDVPGDGVIKDGRRARPVCCKGQGVGYAVVIHVHGVGNVEEGGRVEALQIRGRAEVAMDIFRKRLQRWQHRMVVQ